MALSDTKEAIAEVSTLLKNHLLRLSDIGDVTIGRPQDAVTATPPILNLFLYEIQFDQGLRQLELDEGQPAPLWLVLKYLLTAFDTDTSRTGDTSSDCVEAHSLLGRGMQSLHELSLSSISKSATALQDNPEELNLKFEDASSDLLSKLMQGSEEQYRCSVSFEVRPVMIATRASSSYSLLVGIDYTSECIVREDKGIEQIPVVPSIGPTITAIAPEQFEPGTTLTIRGENLNLSNLSVQLGPIELPIIAQSAEFLQCQIDDDGDINQGRTISAGSQTLAVSQTLASGRLRSSNLILANLIPVITEVEVATSSEPDIFRNIDLTGKLLGRDSDTVCVALYQEGKTVKTFDYEFESLDPPSTTSVLMRRRLKIHDDAVPPGRYRVILSVNHQQARNSPEILLEATP